MNAQYVVGDSGKRMCLLMSDWHRFRMICECGQVITWEVAKEFVTCPSCDRTTRVNYVEVDEERSKPDFYEHHYGEEGGDTK